MIAVRPDTRGDTQAKLQPIGKGRHLFEIQRTREYITILRKMFAREYVEFDGEIYKLPLPDGLGKPLKLMVSLSIRARL